MPPRKTAAPPLSRPRLPRAAVLWLAGGGLTALAILIGAVCDSVPPPASPLPIEAPITQPPWTPDGR